MSFKPGDKKPENSGRQKGTLNKASKIAIDSLLDIFEQLGGIDGAVKHFKKNNMTKGEFYKLFYGKLTPSSIGIAHTGGIDLKHMKYAFGENGVTNGSPDSDTE